MKTEKQIRERIKHLHSVDDILRWEPEEIGGYIQALKWVLGEKE